MKNGDVPLKHVLRLRTDDPMKTGKGAYYASVGCMEALFISSTPNPETLDDRGQGIYLLMLAGF